MVDDFLIRAALAGIGLSIGTGPLGVFVVWRRMAYFGDALAHGAVLGVAIALFFSIPIVFGTILIALLMSVAISFMMARGENADSSLGVLSFGALSLGLVAISFIDNLRIDINVFLFGDILLVNSSDLIWIWGGAIFVAAVIVWRWKSLLLATLSSDLAASAGIKPSREGAIFTVLIAVLVALSIKVVGALLVSALLIIPAVAARQMARTPVKMAVAAVIIGGLSTVLGLAISWQFDTPTGPSIIVGAVGFYVFLSVLRYVLRR